MLRQLCCLMKDFFEISFHSESVLPKGMRCELFLLEMNRDYKATNAMLATVSDCIAQQQPPHPQKHFRFCRQRAFADVVLHDLSAKLFLKLIYSQPFLIAISFVPAPEVIHRDAFRLESLDVLPMMKTIGAADLVAQGAAVELSKKRCRGQQHDPVVRSVVGMPDQRLAGRVAYLRKGQGARTCQQ